MKFDVTHLRARPLRGTIAGLLVFAAALLSTAVPAYAQLVSNTEFAGRLAREHRHLFGVDGQSEIEQLNRELREATHASDAATDDAIRSSAARRARAAADRIRELVATHPRLIRVDLTSSRPALAVDGLIEQPGETGALLFEVGAGGEGQQFSTALRDLTELPRRNNATTVIVDVGASGVTHAVAGLEHLPPGRTTLIVEFRRPGRGNVRLPLDVITPSLGRLKLTLLSDDTGKPVPAMVRLTWRTDGRARPPANRVDLAPQFDSNGKVTDERVAYLPGARQGSFWCVAEPVDMTLSPGRWEIAVNRGFEHTPVFEEVNIRPGETLEKTIRPKRWVIMRQRGWWSGDDHVHGRLVSDSDARNLLAWAQAEDVHLTNLVKMGDVFRTYFEQRGFGPQHRVQSGDYVLAPAQECPRTREIGHVLTMNLTSMVRDTERYFLYDTVFDRVHQQGGLTGYAHASSGMFDVHRDMTLNVPRQKVDFFEIHQFNNLGTDLYYEFLNLGCKVTASAGSDTPWGGTIGEVRVYSYLGRETFSADGWFNAFGRGRTFTTSGPMIEFSVDDALPGDELRVASGRKLRVRARAWSDPHFPAPIRLEIVRHGDIVRATESKDARQPEAEVDFEIDAGDGFWIAARASTGGGTSAHTTPVYVVREGLRFWKFDALDDMIERRLASLKEIEDLVADFRRLDRDGRLVSDLNGKQLALQGPELLKRVEGARQLYAQFKQTAAAERSRRTSASAAKTIKSDPPGWELAVEQTFYMADQFPRWRREGAADLAVTMERTLQVQTKRNYMEQSDTGASTVWFDEATAGDVRIEFDASAEAGSRCAFLFHARPRAAGHDFFAGEQRLAQAEDLADDARRTVLAMDILGAGERTVTLRHLGDEESVATWRQLQALPQDDPRRQQLSDRFDRLTIVQQAPNPFQDPERTYHFDVRVIGSRITVLVDGRVLFDVADSARADRLRAGGYFGFRNTQPTRMAFDNVRVFRATRSTQ